MRIYEKILTNHPQDLTSLNNLAWFYFVEKDARAYKLAERAYVLFPENSYILDTYGLILASKGEVKKAKQLIQKAFRLDPKNLLIKEHLEAL
ncbi:hypothetical protein JI57_03010 [Psychromonas sp. PRT-SC03]|nr:hypothetical protein JI57_03010 [Psychromonas sp. PRT-SC03]